MIYQVPVPSRLLLSRDLPPSARLVWIALQLAGGPAARGCPGRLQARSGLAWDTIQKGLALLESGGWLSNHTGEDVPGSRAVVPVDLLQETRLGIQSKVLYGVLQLTPGFRKPKGQCKIDELSALAGESRTTARHAFWSLRETGWLEASQSNRRCPIHFTLRNPIAEHRTRAVAHLRRWVKAAPHRGEAIMRAYLNLLVASDEYDDDASPSYLFNPYTCEEMQFDRYYPPHVAFEYQGPQHFGPTARYPDEEKARKQQGRDQMKLGICVRRGITLVYVQAEDLTLNSMRAKVQGLLPLQNLDGRDREIAFLEAFSREYRRNPFVGLPSPALKDGGRQEHSR